MFLLSAKHHAVKAYGGVKVQFHVFLISALDEDEWSASPPGKELPGPLG